MIFKPYNEELQENGYIIFRKEIPQERVEYGKEQINDKVNYYRLKEFIDNDLMKKVNIKLNTNLDYLKYRVSNNNNSTDAGSFHRDIHSYAGVPEIYTCLTYLDVSIMEIIVGSHKKISIPFFQIIKYLRKRKKIKMNPGDILVFNAALIHRGLFYKSNNKNRRIIQLFDCVENKDYYTESIMHIPCRDQCSNKFSNFNLKINKKKTLSELVNKYGLLTTFSGYGLKCNGLKHLTTDKKVKYLSTEGEMNRYYGEENNDMFLDTNIYIMNGYREKNIERTKRKKFIFYEYELIPILILILIVFMILSIFFLSYKLKQNNKKIYI